MLFARVEKHGKYRDAWTLRRIAFDTETGHMYCTDKLDNFRVLWKHNIKAVRIIAKATVTDFNFREPNFDPRDVFSFRVEGSYRHVGDGIPDKYLQPTGDEADRTVFRPRTPLPEEEKKKAPARDEGTGDMLVWYMRTESHGDFMQIYNLIRDTLIRDGMRPPQFWGLPKMDPRIQVPLAEPPLYLWYRFRAVKQSVFYACVHGHVALKAGDSQDAITLSKEPMYLTLFDTSVMVFRENGHVFEGLPITGIEALHYAATDVDASVKDAANAKQKCFMSLLSRSKEFSDILFLPALEPFADASAEHAPATQVQRFEFALKHLNPLVKKVEEKAGHGSVPAVELREAKSLMDEVGDATGTRLERYVRAMAKQRDGGLNLPDETTTDENKDKERSEHLIHELPAPHRLATLASQLGIHMKRAVTDYPSADEYLCSDATVEDPTCRFKRDNVLRDLFIFRAIF